jgi:hypothetical protein
MISSLSNYLPLSMASVCTFMQIAHNDDQSLTPQLINSNDACHAELARFSHNFILPIIVQA